MATVYIVDEMVAQPGMGRMLLDAYKNGYVPSAQARGMVLERIVVAPPVWLDEGCNRLLATWTVEGAGGWWGQCVQSRYDPAVARFWQDAALLIECRSRYFGSVDSDVEELCNV
jgi:hypothetical protein